MKYIIFTALLFVCTQAAAEQLDRNQIEEKNELMKHFILEDSVGELGLELAAGISIEDIAKVERTELRECPKGLGCDVFSGVQIKMKNHESLHILTGYVKAGRTDDAAGYFYSPSVRWIIGPFKP